MLSSFSTQLKYNNLSNEIVFLSPYDTCNKGKYTIPITSLLHIIENDIHSFN